MSTSNGTSASAMSTSKGTSASAILTPIIIINKAFPKPVVHQRWSSAHTTCRAFEVAVLSVKVLPSFKETVFSLAFPLSLTLLYIKLKLLTEIELQLDYSCIILIGRRKSETAAVSMCVVWGYNEDFVSEQVELAHQRLQSCRSSSKHSHIY
jgi:hypothetical protein